MFSRLELLIGEECLNKLKQSKVIVFGAGGVGGYVIEALVRSGISHICVVDNDEVSVSNLNRQIIATVDTVGRKKTDVIKERILSINPDCFVETKDMFYLPENADSIDLKQYDYVVDAMTGEVIDILGKRTSAAEDVTLEGADGKEYTINISNSSITMDKDYVITITQSVKNNSKMGRLWLKNHNLPYSLYLFEETLFSSSTLFGT